MASTDDQLTPPAGWHLVDSALRARYDADSPQQAAAMVLRCLAVAGSEHRVDVDLRGASVNMALHNGSGGAATAQEVAAAHRIASAETELRGVARPATARTLHVAIDTVDAAAIRPFWREALGYAEQPRGEVVDLVDPTGSGPRVWFQTMDPPRTQRSRTHLDVYVPLEHAAELVDRVVAAGGTVRDDSHAPDWWVLADIEGNEVCLCTSPP